MRTVEMDDRKRASPITHVIRGRSRWSSLITAGRSPFFCLLENADIETANLSSHPHFWKLIERSCSRLAAEGGIPGDEVRPRLGLGTA